MIDGSSWAQEGGLSLAGCSHPYTGPKVFPTTIYIFCFFAFFFDIYAISPKSNRVAYPDSGMLGETLYTGPKVFPTTIYIFCFFAFFFDINFMQLAQSQTGWPTLIQVCWGKRCILVLRYFLLPLICFSCLRHRAIGINLVSLIFKWIEYLSTFLHQNVPLLL